MLIEQFEVGVDAFAPGRHHLVRRDRDGADLFLRARVFADLVVGQRRALQQLVPPLPGRDRVRHEDQRGGLRAGHRSRADDGFPCATRQNDDARPAVPEPLDGFALVGPHRPAVFDQRDRVGLAVDVTREIFGRPAELEQHLLQVTALARVDHHGVVVEARADHRRDLRAAEHLFEHCSIDAAQHQAVRRIVGELEPAVAGHRLGDVDQQRMRNRVTAVLQQRVDDLFGVVARCTRIPQSERRQAIGVHVLGGALEFCEGCDRAPAFGRKLMFDFEQKSLVGLHDQRSVCHYVSVPDARLAGGASSSASSSASRSRSAITSVNSATPVMRWIANVRGSSRR